MGIPHETTSSTQQLSLTPFGEACLRVDLTAIHEILEKIGYKDDEGIANEVWPDDLFHHCEKCGHIPDFIELKISLGKTYRALFQSGIALAAGRFLWICNFSNSLVSPSHAYQQWADGNWSGFQIFMPIKELSSFFLPQLHRIVCWPCYYRESLKFNCIYNWLKNAFKKRTRGMVIWILEFQPTKDSHYVPLLQFVSVAPLAAFFSNVD